LSFFLLASHIFFYRFVLQCINFIFYHCVCGLLNEIIIKSAQLDLFLDIFTKNTKFNVRLNLTWKNIEE
jgi:hypothetical protein